MNNKNNSTENKFETRARLLKDRILKSNVAKPELIKGCSEKEISDLEKKCDVVFPESYKVFLENFGHGLGGIILSDIDILYEDIFGLTDRLRNEVLIYEGDPILPKNAFVFATRFGEQFMFFDTSTATDEPPILHYMENHKSFSKVGNSIFDILEKETQLSYRLKMESEERRKKRKNR